MNHERRGLTPKGVMALAFAAAAATSSVLPSRAQAATYNWTPVAAGTYNWDEVTSNWGGGFPNAAADIANLTANLTGAQTINLNQAITLGALNIGDPTTGFFGYTIAPGTAGSLIFNNSGAGATLTTTNVATGVVNLISASSILADNLTVNTQSTNGLTISGIIGETGGARVLTKIGTGLLTLSGPNTYTGGTTITGLLNANNSAALGTGAVTINNAAGNQLQLGNGVNVGNALTINGGGVAVQGAVYVPTGNATYSGSVNITGAASAGAHFATAASTSILNVTGGIASTVPVTVRNGYVIFNGTNNYTTGTTLGNAGALLQFGKIVSMPGTGAVSAISGSSIGVNAGGTGEWTGPGTGAGTIAGLLAGTGGQGTSTVSLAAGSSLAIDTSNAVGNVTYSGAFTSANSVGLLKLGTGTLELTGGGTYAGAGVGGYPFIVRRGTTLLNGGTHNVTGELVVGGQYGTANAAAGYDATLRVDAGALNVSTWFSLGRGNGTGAVSSDVIVNNNAAITTVNFSAGFNGGSGTNLPKGTFTLNNTSSFTSSGVFKLGESTGSNMTLTINNSATLTRTGAAVMWIGYQGGNGTLNMNGGTLNNTAADLQVSGTDANGAFGGGSGTWNMAGGTATVGSLTVSRGNNNAYLNNGTVNVTGGTLTSINDITLGFAGAGNLGKLNVAGGTVNVGTTAAKWLQVGVWDTSKGEVAVSSGSLNLNTNGAIKFNTQGTIGANVVNQTGGNITFYSDNATTVGGTGVVDMQTAGAAASNNTYNLDGGTLTVPRVVSTAVTGTRTFNFNGGTLKAATTSVDLMALGAGNAFANVRNNGAKIDSNGNNVTLSQPLIHSNIITDNPVDGGLTKSGAGTLTLSGGNTYNGATTVNGGSLVFGTTSTSASSSVAVNSAAKFVHNSTTPFSGSVILNSGTLDGTGSVNTVNVASSTSNIIANGDGTTSTFTIGSLSFTDLGNINLNVASTARTDSAGTPLLATTTLNTGANAAGKITINANQLTWTPGIYNLIGYTTLSGIGFGDFQKGTITGLSAGQTATLVNSAGFIALQIAGDNPRWSGLGNGNWISGTQTPKNWKFISSGADADYVNGAAALFNDSAEGTTTVNISAANVTAASVVFDNSSKNYTLTGAFGIAGSTGLTKIGTGQLEINNANTYIGGTTLAAGTLAINNASAIGTGALTITGGSLDNTSGSPITLSTNNTQNWNADFSYTGSNGNLDLGTGTATMSASRTVTVNNNTLKVSGVLAGTGLGLTKAGSGTLELSGANTYNNTTVITGGELKVSGGTTGTLTAAASSDIQIAPNSSDTGTLNVTGGVVNANRVIVSGASTNNTIGGNATLNQSAGTINSQQWFTVGSGGGGGGTGTYNMSGGTLNVIGQQMEVANFAGTSGTVNLSNGTINIYNNNFITLGANNNASLGIFNQTGGTVTFYSDAGTTVGGTGVLSLGRATTSSGQFLYTLSGGTLTVPQIAHTGGGGAIFQFDGGLMKAAKTNATFMQGLSQAQVLNGANIDTNTFNITIAQNLEAVGSGGLTKTGAGTLTLNGANSYSGATTVNSGTLVLTGATSSLSSTSGITINGGSKFIHASPNAINAPVSVVNGTVDGTGTFDSVTVTSGAGNTVANGNGTTGALSINNLTFNGSGALTLSTASTSPVLITNTLTTTGGSIAVNAANASWLTGTTYNLASYGSLNSFAPFTLGTITGLNPRQSASLSNPTGFIALTINGDTPVWTGLSSGNWTTTAVASPKNWKLQTAGTPTDFITTDTVLFDDTAAGTTSVNISDANVATTSVVFNNSSKNYTVSSTSTFGISAGTLAKSGTGALTLNTNNTYAGGTTLNAGTLNLNKPSAIGTGALTVTAGTLGNTSGAGVALSTNNALTATGDFSFAGPNDLDLGTGAVNLGVGDRTITTTAGALTIGEVTTVGSGLTKQGGGTLILNSVGAGAAGSNIGGTLTVAAGTLGFNRPGAAGATSGDLYVANLAGTGTIMNTGGDVRWMFVDGSSDSTFGGTIVDGTLGTGLAKRGISTLTLTGVNTYTNQTTVEGGTLTFSGAGTAASSTLYSISNGVLSVTGNGQVGPAQINITSDGGATGATGRVQLAGNASVASPIQLAPRNDPGLSDAIRNVSGNNTLSGLITIVTGGSQSRIQSDAGLLTISGGITTTAASNRNLYLQGAGNGVVSSPIASLISVTKTGAGTWTLSGANTYTGSTTVNSGVLKTVVAVQNGQPLNVVTGGLLDVPVNGGASGVTSVGALNVDTGFNSRINLHDNDLIINYGAGPNAYADTVLKVKSGLVSLGGAGTDGIVSPEADGLTPGTSLAVVDNAVTALTSLSGFTIPNPTTSVLVKFTWLGDANLDGIVDGTDYALTDSGFAGGGTTWDQGDYNYSGGVDGTDYALIDTGFGSQSGTLPEPTALGLLGLGAMGMLRRRRRQA